MVVIKRDNLQLSLIILTGLIFVFVIVYMIFVDSSSIEIVHVTNNITVVSEDYVPVDELVNINSAELEDFVKLEGIGEKTAEKIIEYRDENGLFQTIYELQYVISAKKFDTIKKYLTV